MSVLLCDVSRPAGWPRIFFFCPSQHLEKSDEWEVDGRSPPSSLLKDVYGGEGGTARKKCSEEAKLNIMKQGEIEDLCLNQMNE